MTISAVAEHKKINLTKNEVDIRLRVSDSPPWVSSYVVDIDIGTGLTQRERKLLYNVARSCEVHKILAGESNFQFSLRDTESSGAAKPDDG